MHAWKPTHSFVTVLNHYVKIFHNDVYNLKYCVIGGGTNFISRIKEQETRLNLHEHDDDDNDDVLSILK
jgi:hypothetical protein